MEKILRILKLSSLVVGFLVLGSCGGGGGSGASGQQPASATSSLVIATVDAAASPVIAVVTDNTGKEKIALIGTKDSSGAPISVMQALYISASGEAGTITMGADGLPASLSDAVGDKITFTNFTDNTMDITQFDPAGNKVAGPVTVNVDPTVLAKLRANAVTLASSSTQGTSLVTGVFSGISTQDWVDISANTAGTAAGLVGCYGVIFAPVVTVASGGVAAPLAVPLFALSASACVSTLVKAVNDISGINRPTYISVADTTAGVGADCLAEWSPVNCAVNIATAVVPLTLNATAPPPSVPTGLTLSKVQANQVSFNWAGSSGSYAWISGYRVYRDGSQIADGAGTSYVDTKVSPGTRYCYTVAAHDVNGKSSGVSDPLCVTIPVATLFVSATTPVSGTSGIPVSNAVFATFNEAINASTLNGVSFTVTGPSGPVMGAVTYNSATNSAVFTPSANLAYAVTYSATVTTEVKDLSGNPLASNYSWNFTTVGGETTPLSFTVLNPASVSTGAVGYQPTLTASGANFSNLTQIRFDWSGVTSGSAIWVKGTASWDPSKITVYSDGLMTLMPVVTQTGDPTGITNWTVTLTDTAGVTATKTFTVNYTPPTPTCTLPQVLTNGVCVTPSPTCTAPQVLQGTQCVTPTTVCTAPQTLVNGLCVTPTQTCVLPQVLQNGVCVTPTTTCTPPQVLTNGVCVTPTTVCTAPQTLVNGQCVTPTTTTCTLPQVLQNGVCVTPGSTPALSITTTAFNPATATVNVGYAAMEAVAATGGQTPYSCSASGLPNGMAMNASTCAVSGTPTVSGTFNVNVTVADSSNPQKTASKVLTLTVAPAATPALPAGYVVQGGLTWMPETSYATNWADANAYCANTAINGQTGWRLPTQQELIALHSAYPGYPSVLSDQGWNLGVAWSSTPSGTGSHYTISVGTGIGIGLYDTVPGSYMTCVR